MNLENFKNKKVLILGLGREGIDTFRLLRRLFPKKTLGIADVKRKIQNTKYKIQNIRWHLGENYLKALKSYDVIIKSPGIPIHLPEVERVFKKGKITSQTEIFFENCPGKIVGITGTKGKSTTSSLIYKILKKGKFPAHLIGNIGKPVLQLLFSATKRDVYIYELSSHQLYCIRKSPYVAVFLNIYPEHLDYYRNFKEYANTKANITHYQTKNDYLIFNSENKIVREIAKKSKARKIPFGKLVRFDLTREEIPLKGDFNLQNIAAAIEVGKIFGVSDENIRKAIRKFKPLAHRLEFVGKYRGVKFYNDSLSTIPESAICAINALGKDVQTVLLGGFERNPDFTKLARKVLESKIKTVILFPSTGERIWKKIVTLSKKRKGLPRHFFVDDMKEAVALVYQNTEKGKICLLSCASPSFGIFKDYKERGNLFKKYVRLFARI